MTSRRVRQEIDELSQEITCCETMMSSLHKDKHKKLVSNNAVHQPRSKSAVGLATTRCQNAQHDCGIGVTPNIKLSSSHQENKRTSTSKKSSKQHFELRHKANPSAVSLQAKRGKDIRTTVAPQYSPHTLVASNSMLKCMHHSTKLEIPKQTNVNFDFAAKLPVAPRHSNTIQLETKKSTWGHRFREENKTNKFTAIKSDPQKEYLQPGYSKSRDSVCRPSHIPSRSSNYIQSTCSHTAEQYDSIVITSSVTESLQSCENLGREADQQSSSTITRTTDMSHCDTAIHKLSDDVTMINPVRLLNFLVKELGGKIDGRNAGMSKGDGDTRQLISEIERTLCHIPSGDDVPRIPVRESVEVRASRSRSPPERDTDAQNKTAASLHRNLRETWKVTESAVKKACVQLREEKDQLQEQIALKKEMLDSANNKENVYLQTIDSLKSRLETASKQNDEFSKTIEKLSSLNEGLIKENQVISTLRANLAKTGQRLDDSTRETQKLSAFITSLQLELEKTRAELEQKDVDYVAFKTGMLENHRIVADQLATMKTYRCEVLSHLDSELEKLGNAGHPENSDGTSSPTDADSSDADRGAGESDRRPVTSSPTSTASSIANGIDPSWQRISNISNHSDRLELRLPDNEVHSISSSQSILHSKNQLLPIFGGNKSDSQLDVNVSGQQFQSLRLSDSSEVTIDPSKVLEPTRPENTGRFREIKKLTKFNVNAELPSPSNDILSGRNGRSSATFPSDNSRHASVSKQHVQNKLAQ